MTGSPAIPVYIVPDADLEKNGGHIPVLGQPAIPITGLSGLQFYSGTSNPPTASPANVNAPAQYYNTSTKFYWNWDIGLQTWIPVPKVYRALLLQSGTNAPTATIVVNTFGATPSWSYVSAGVYTLTLTNGFLDGKWFALVTGNNIVYSAHRMTDNTFRFQTNNPTTGSPSNNLMSAQTSFELLAYP